MTSQQKDELADATLAFRRELGMLTAWLKDTRYPDESRQDWDAAVTRMLAALEPATGAGRKRR